MSRRGRKTVLAAVAVVPLLPAGAAWFRIPLVNGLEDPDRA
ncbi:hypothetical protein V1L54_02575 [Streptomyces sp. TRM 70361]|nr:hypothetical protein [Streptomyces sp. TRM 70361]MEE1938305.1 hypothetical protein [Streptomyces sp. TRM 70361]